jgi:hypothetical protein
MNIDGKTRRYRVVREFHDWSIPSRVIRQHLTLAQAQAHCRSPETSSRTCRKAQHKALTARIGGWFDGYDEE